MIKLPVHFLLTLSLLSSTASAFGGVDIAIIATARTNCLTPNGELVAIPYSNYTGEETFTYQWYYGMEFNNTLDAGDLVDGSALDGLGTDHLVGLEEGIYGVKATSTVTGETGSILAVIEFDPQVQEVTIVKLDIRNVFEADGHISIESVTGDSYDLKLYDEHPAHAVSPLEDLGIQSDFPVSFSPDLDAGEYFVSITDQQTGCSSLESVIIDTAFYVWEGATDKDWNNPNSWNRNEIPSEGSDVLLKDRSDWININGQSLTLRNLLVEDDVLFDIQDTDMLLTGDLYNEGFINLVYASTLKIEGESSGGGHIGVITKNVSDGSLHMSGAPIGGYKSLAQHWFAYDNTSSSYEALGEGDIFERGTGYFVGFNVGVSKSYIGHTLNYEKNCDVWVTDASSEGGDGFNMLSNPFLSYLSVEDFLDHPDNEEACTGIIYIWNDGGENYGDTRAGNYVTINNMGITGQTPINGTAGQTDFSVYNGYLDVTQGFFIEAVKDGYMRFTSDMSYGVGRDFEPPAAFRKGENPLATLRLTLSNATFQDDLLVGLHPDATHDADYALDAKKKAGNLPLSIAGTQNGDSYSIIALPPLVSSIEEIPLDLRMETGSTTELAWDPSNDFFLNYTAWISNPGTGEMYDLEQSNVISLKSFSTDYLLTIGSKNEVLMTSEERNKFKVFGSTDELTVRYAHNGRYKLVFYTLSGQVVYNTHIEVIENEAVFNDLPLLANEIYLVKLGQKSYRLWLRE